MKDLFTNRKGQSAIEYLMTYGWMLLVVAIVGGAVITTIQSQSDQCNGEVPTALQAQQQGFGITQFGVGTNGVQVVLKNNGQESVSVTNVTVDSNTASTTPGDTNLGLNEEATWEFNNYSPAQSCSTVTVNITYDKGSLTGQTMSGDIDAQLQ